MRRHRSSQAQFLEPSLVPFADTVNATVGFMLFVLILTVLAAGGAIVPKQLPIERRTEARPLFVLCAADRLLPLDRTLTRRFEDAMQRPRSFAEIERWLAAFRQHREEDSLFVVRGEGSVSYQNLGHARQARLDLVLKYAPKPGLGDTAEDLGAGAGHFLRALRARDPAEHFAYFVVEPGCIELFQRARELARAHRYVTGWAPHRAGEAIGFSLTGTGRSAIAQ